MLETELDEETRKYLARKIERGIERRGGQLRRGSEFRLSTNSFNLDPEGLDSLAPDTFDPFPPPRGRSNSKEACETR